MGAVTSVGPGTTTKDTAPGANPGLEDCHQMIFDLILNAAEKAAEGERESLELSERLFDLGSTCEEYIVKKDQCFERSSTREETQSCKMPGTYPGLNDLFKKQFEAFKQAERDYLGVDPERPVARKWRWPI
jgi:hypothetical protein